MAGEPSERGTSEPAQTGPAPNPSGRPKVVFADTMPAPILEGMDGAPVDLEPKPAPSLLDRACARIFGAVVRGLNAGHDRVAP